MGRKIFKRCPRYSQIWSIQDQFITDRQLELNGYMTDFEKLEYCLFLFTHNQTCCRSTMALRVSNSMNLYKGPINKERKTGTGECPGYCRDRKQLDRCDALCECAFSREILQIIMLRKRAKYPSHG